MPIAQMDTLSHRPFWGGGGTVGLSEVPGQEPPTTYSQPPLLTFPPPLEHVPAEGSQACGQQKGQQHQDRRQDSDHWEGHPVGQMEGAQWLLPDISSGLCTVALLF